MCFAPGASFTDPEVWRTYATSQFGLIVKSNVRCVFSLDLKVACDGLDCISLGRQFRTVDETKQKEHLAKSDVT